MLQPETIKIIITDDHKMFRDGLKYVLEKIPGTQVIAEASNGEEFLGLLDIHRPDIVLMDIKMPIMDGCTATKLIKELRPDLPVIAQSAYTLEQYHEKYNENPFDDYITKPINENVLKQKIMKYIDKSSKFDS